MTRTPIAQILSSEEVPDSVLVQGWVRTKRESKAFSFIELNDGSCLSNLQIVADAVLPGYEDAVLHLTTGASVSVEGKIVPSRGKGQKCEM